MKRKHLVVLISVLLIIGVTITTLFATGVLHLKVFNDISSNADTDNENEIQDDLQEEGNQHSLEQQVSVLNETAGGNADNSSNDQEVSEVSEDNKIPENRIEVLNNSTEYEIEMYSYLDDSDNLCMVIDYYFDGVSHSALFKQGDFPELERIFETENEALNNKVSTSSGNSIVLRLSNAILNTKHGKVYFTAERDLQAGEKFFFLYVLSLKDKTIKFLYQGTGYAFNTYLLSPDKDYIAFDHFKDEKGNNSLIHIFSSKDDTALVIDNMTKDGRLIGSDLSSEELLKEGKTVSYYLIRWRTLEDLKLREYSYIFDNTQNLIKDEQSYEVSYNILKNTMIYPEGKYAIEGSGLEKGQETESDTKKDEGKDADTVGVADPDVKGSSEQSASFDEKSDEILDNKTPDPKSDAQQNTEAGKQEGTDAGVEAKNESGTQSDANSGSPSEASIQEGSNDGNDKVGAESEQVAVLKSFYKYVAEGNYEKAYDLFDDNFESTSQMFMGIKISKKEITLEMFQGFAEAVPQIFKNVKIEKILKEEQTDDSYKIYYTQSLALDPSMEPAIYPLIVTMRKVTGTWKIMHVDDGTLGVDPFK